MADVFKTVNPGGGADFVSMNAAIANAVSTWTPAGSDKFYIDVTGNDTVAIAVAGAPAGQTSSNPIIVRAAAGQQHAGTYNTAKARHTVGGLAYQTGMIEITGAPNLYLTFQYMQFENTVASGTIPVHAAIALGAGQVLFDGCLIRFTGTSMPTFPGDLTAVLLNKTATNSATIEYRNCIMWNGGVAYGKYGYSTTPGVIKFRNCTIYKFVPGPGDDASNIRGMFNSAGNHDGGTFDITNTFVQSDLPDTFDGCYSSGVYLMTGSTTIISTGFATSDATSPNTGLRSLSPSFVNAGSFDLHLNTGDTALKDAGTDMSGTYTNDIDAQTAVSRNDIGADELTVYNPPVLPYVYVELKAAP